MTDLMQQLRTHADHLDADAAPVTWAEIVDRAAPSVTTRAVPGWVVAAAVAAAVVALVGVFTIETFRGESDVAAGALAVPGENASVVQTPFGAIRWWTISGGREVPGTGVLALPDGRWAAADQQGQSWRSSDGIRWRLAEPSDSRLNDVVVLDNGVWIRRGRPASGQTLEISWDGGTTFAPVVRSTDHPDPNLAWEDIAVSMAPLEDGVMVMWSAIGTVPWNRILGTDDPVIDITSLSSPEGESGDVVVFTGTDRATTGSFDLRVGIEGEDAVVRSTDGRELWRHPVPAGHTFAPGDEGPDALVGALVHQIYDATFAMQLVSPRGAEVVAVPSDRAFDDIASEAAMESYVLMSGDELRLVVSVPPIDEENDPWQISIWRWNDDGWVADDGPSWGGADVRWVSTAAPGSDAVTEVRRSDGSDVVTEWWLDFDRAPIRPPVEVAVSNGIVFPVDGGGIIASDFDSDWPRFWLSLDEGMSWTEITDPAAAAYGDQGSGASRVWADRDRVFVINEPFDGTRVFRVADLSNVLSPGG